LPDAARAPSPHPHRVADHREQAGRHEGHDGVTAREVGAEGQADDQPADDAQHHEPSLPIPVEQAGHGSQPAQERDKHRHRVEQHQALFLAIGRQDQRNRGGEEHRYSPVGRVVTVSPQQEGQQNSHPFPAPGKGLKQARARLEGGAGRGEQQNGAGNLERGEQPAAADCRLRHLRNPGGAAGRQRDMQANAHDGQARRQPDHDRHHEP
jgi:hypothetical protein